MLIEVARILWLRRLWVVLAIIAGLVGGAAVFLLTPPRQQSSAQVLFVPSIKQPGVEGPTNPFLSLGGSVAVVASLVQIQVSDDNTAAQLAERGATAKYEVAPNLSENAGPILIITTDDTSSDNSAQTLTAVIGVIQKALRQTQVDRGVPDDLMVTSVVLTATPEPKVVRKAQMQSTVVVVLAATLLLIGLLLLVERRRRSRIEARSRARALSSGERTRRRPRMDDLRVDSASSALPNVVTEEGPNSSENDHRRRRVPLMTNSSG